MNKKFNKKEAIVLMSQGVFMGYDGMPRKVESIFMDDGGGFNEATDSSVCHIDIGETPYSGWYIV